MCSIFSFVKRVRQRLSDRVPWDEIERVTKEEDREILKIEHMKLYEIMHDAILEDKERKYRGRREELEVHYMNRSRRILDAHSKAMEDLWIMFESYMESCDEKKDKIALLHMAKNTFPFPFSSPIRLDTGQLRKSIYLDANNQVRVHTILEEYESS